MLLAGKKFWQGCPEDPVIFQAAIGQHIHPKQILALLLGPPVRLLPHFLFHQGRTDEQRFPGRIIFDLLFALTAKSCRVSGEFCDSDAAVAKHKGLLPLQMGKLCLRLQRVLQLIDHTAHDPGVLQFRPQKNDHGI